MPEREEILSAGFDLGNELDYMLDRTYTAAARLNYQFFLWKECLQFNLHPSIDLGTESKEIQIADLATGTGIWLCNLARDPAVSKYTRLRLEGLDIDLSNAPDEEWLAPRNITLRQWDMFEDVPDDLIEKYDVVHLRLLILVVQDSDPLPIIEKVFKMLKPGGYIQWDDLNCRDFIVRKSKRGENKPTPACDSYTQFMHSNGRHDWVMDLPRLIEGHGGFTNAQQWQYTDTEPPELFKANGDQCTSVMEEFAARLRAAGKVEEVARICEMINGLAQESRDGAHLFPPKMVCVAQKRV